MTAVRALTAEDSINPSAGKSSPGHGEEIPDRLPAVGAKHAAGRVARLLARQKSSTPRNILARPDAAHRHALAPAFVNSRISIHRLSAGRADVAGRDRIGADAVGRPLH